MRELCQNTVDSHKHSRWDSYNRTQQNTADGAVTTEQSRWGSYKNRADETVMLEYSRQLQLQQNTQQMGKLQQNKDETVTLEYSRWDSYRIKQMGKLQQKTVDTVIRWDSYIRTR